MVQRWTAGATSAENGAFHWDRVHWGRKSNHCAKHVWKGEQPKAGTTEPTGSVRRVRDGGRQAGRRPGYNAG